MQWVEINKTKQFSLCESEWFGMMIYVHRTDNTVELHILEDINFHIHSLIVHSWQNSCDYFCLMANMLLFHSSNGFGCENEGCYAWSYLLDCEWKLM